MAYVDLQRRSVLRRIGGVAALSTLVGAGVWTGRYRPALRAASASTAMEGPFDVDLRVRARPDKVAILPGAPSDVWRYTAERIVGPEDTLTPVGESYTGPLIRLRRGQRLRVRIDNDLPEDTTVHWHGLHVPPDVDGQPRLPIAPATSMAVAFDVVDRAGLYWYHPHPHGPDGGRVGFQSYAGLAGPLIINDDAERALELPDGERELVLILQDRTFSNGNELQYIDDGGMGAMMTRMQGFRGERVLVNGHPDARREVSTQPYRLRLLNGSNSRIYKLAWSDGRAVTVIGTDGGLLAKPERRRSVTLAPAQRIDLWVDFGDTEPGESVQLVSEEYQLGMMGERMGDMMDRGMMGDRMGGMMDRGMMGDRMGEMMDRGMMRDMMGSERLSLVTFAVVARANDAETLPERLAQDLPASPVQADTPVRRFELGMRMMQGFTINGRQMEGATVADDEIVRLAQTEIWEFVNNTMMPHPMHVHGLQFLVQERISAGGKTDLHDGIIDAGLHDTVLVFPEERVRIALTFKDFEGFYMYHCHTMEHEDAGMMRYFKVVA
ncbi:MULTISPECIES: multicopper oxidase family protein [Halomonas]|jgi:FtsP/CotA-like multicopper oxidase with cupredoxin domain|uniref:Copper oxidase n=1 Tax=Halomonas litopenaei TaxID=2109328 RepID=A0ABX5IX16_9GAMM|nr:MULTISPECIES: multicopper oxidase domain-containing protein [Halomonas]KFF50355.1 copper oxidase [Gammaproteobacteria bacterium MFB021]MBR9773223.1 multicopper oxidase domain-containing protein [Gammaproteobacteria bacterium]MED5297010.1 multicopper oxidase domain-containing protein [Pseudomonadota bacterium]KJZ17287.1 copper oxidase [Halomonas sp. S2151]MAR74688.1 copper oxidase [Halomonas sp.]